MTSGPSWRSVGSVDRYVVAVIVTMRPLSNPGLRSPLATISVPMASLDDAATRKSVVVAASRSSITERCSDVPVSVMASGSDPTLIGLITGDTLCALGHVRSLVHASTVTSIVVLPVRRFLRPSDCGDRNRDRLVRVGRSVVNLCLSDAITRHDNGRRALERLSSAVAFELSLDATAVNVHAFVCSSWTWIVMDTERVSVNDHRS